MAQVVRSRSALEENCTRAPELGPEDFQVIPRVSHHWSLCRWAASNAGGKEARAMVPALRENDSMASQTQESSKASKEAFPRQQKGWCVLAE